MNDDHLLKAFDRLGDEPETVQQFRKLVIGLALSGKLVAPNDVSIDPANLLKQIEAKKRDLVQQGVVRKQKLLATLSYEDLPKGFNVPANFVRLGSIARVEKGLTGIMKARPGPYPLVVTAEDRTSCDHFDFDGAAAIVPLVSSAGHGKASLHRLHYQEGKFALGSILAAIFPHAPELISARFLFEYLTSFKDELLVAQMIGTANVSLSVGKVSDVPVPLVPPAVQRKVDELMGLCDRLEGARASREAVRDKLAAASLARLNTPDPKTFQDDARLALDALPALTTRPDQIKALRQTILNLAVRGKLVPQDSTDEPASELLKRIAKERAELVERKEIRRENPLDPIQPAEMPFGVPATWVWSRIGEAVLFTQYGTSQKSNPSEKGVPVLTMGNIQNGLMVWNNEKRIPETSEDLPALYLQKLDLLYNRTNSAELVGKTGIYLGEDSAMTFASYLIRLRPSLLSSNPRFLNMAMNTSEFRETQIVPLIKKQTGQANVNGTALKNMLIPLPPLAEQHRIVAKVDALMALCDRLEASLTSTAATRRHLLDALLAEALAPAEGHELQAAE